MKTMAKDLAVIFRETRLVCTCPSGLLLMQTANIFNIPIRGLYFVCPINYSNYESFASLYHTTITFDS